MLIELIDKRFEDVNRRFEDINRRFEDVNERFIDFNKRFEDINRRFEDVNHRFEEISQRPKLLGSTCASKDSLVLPTSTKSMATATLWSMPTPKALSNLSPTSFQMLGLITGL